MLYAAIALALIQLLIVNALARRPATLYGAVVGSSVVLTGGLNCLQAIFPVLLLQSLFLLVAAGLWHWSRRGRWWFVPLSTAASLIAFGFVTWSALEAQARYDRLQARSGEGTRREAAAWAHEHGKRSTRSGLKWCNPAGTAAPAGA